MTNNVDIVLINPGDRKRGFQNLGADLAAIEPPFWIAAIAAYLRNRGFEVCVIDSNAENISPEETAQRVNEFNPILAAVIVYGSNPQGSTQNMTIACKICGALKEMTVSKVIIGGLHPSALPQKTLEEENADYVIEGEGPYTLEALLNVLKAGKTDFSKVPGLWYREKEQITHNSRAPLIENLDTGIPAGAFDLLPMHKYKAHNWHCFDHIHDRTPYAAVYTSLGCPFSCNFCCINAPFGKPGIRFRSPGLVASEIGLLVEKYGVKNIKIVDELFILKDEHYMGIADLIIKNNYDLNIWAYARVDTVNPGNLKIMKKAGINWLALGIESASTLVRDGTNKQIKAKDIIKVVRTIQNEGIRVGANYIFGLPDDNMETMNETLNLALEINSEYANFYSAMAYPGSKLYDLAIKEKWELPKSWHAFSQYSYEILPLPTKYLTPAQVLRFRDDAFQRYFENPKYLNMIEKVFNAEAREHIQEMTKVRLKRKLLGD